MGAGLVLPAPVVFARHSAGPNAPGGRYAATRGMARKRPAVDLS